MNLTAGSAMYLSRSSPEFEPAQVAAPSPTSGLYIYPRSASSAKQEAVKVSIPLDCLGELIRARIG